MRRGSIDRLTRWFKNNIFRWRTTVRTTTTTTTGCTKFHYWLTAAAAAIAKGPSTFCSTRTRRIHSLSLSLSQNTHARWHTHTLSLFFLTRTFPSLSSSFFPSPLSFPLRELASKSLFLFLSLSFSNQRPPCFFLSFNISPSLSSLPSKHVQTCV